MVLGGEKVEPLNIRPPVRPNARKRFAICALGSMPRPKKRRREVDKRRRLLALLADQRARPWCWFFALFALLAKCVKLG